MAGVPRTIGAAAATRRGGGLAALQHAADEGRLAGVVTDVCVAFPALCALEEGYQVFVVVDASGTFNKSVRDAALVLPYRLVDAEHGFLGATGVVGGTEGLLSS